MGRIVLGELEEVEGGGECWIRDAERWGGNRDEEAWVMKRRQQVRRRLGNEKSRQGGR